ncbi:hypothetical protein D9756_009434 [Leucocoprinus leucothites]|uniref:Uncharacterized protein n=1 Tax=Leucocoprinus leucothites TaxID=201217 RepID=A0A8H5FU87_9AGAR|nr:hypothetical protein D9756_009434 [Leucoagaricus leucothites]
MLNLHETAELGIWSISGWTTYDGTGDGGAAETQGTVIELDTFVTESSRRDGFGTTRGSVTPPGLERIDEEEAVGGENRLMERMGWSSSAGPSRTAGRTMRGILI